jgi:primosomal replication protein N
VDSNRVTLTGELAQLEPLRHTPAGIPLLNFRLAHKSQQLEAGYRRQVECEVNGIAIGEVAVAMSKMQAGAEVKLDGFLNRKNRMSAQLILHVAQARMLKDTDHAKTGIGQR